MSMNDIFLAIGILFSIAIAVCFKKLISKHTSTGTNQEPAIIWTFAIFSGIPIMVLILLGIIPKITASCVLVSGEKEFCISDAKKEMTGIKEALEKSVEKIPLMADESGDVEEGNKPHTDVNKSNLGCKPYMHTDGYTPSAGLILVGKQNNWFAIVSSIYDRDKAFRYADSLEKKSKSSYKVEIYSAKDSSEKEVFAITLGGKLSQSEAEKRVCYAQLSKIFQKDSFVWANDGWGDNLRKK